MDPYDVYVGLSTYVYAVARQDTYELTGKNVIGDVTLL